MNQYAYVTFIIRNDSYLPGALVFAYGLRKQETKHDLICIVSENISKQAKDALFVLYDDVITIDEVYVPHEQRHERQDRPFLFSRFNAFRLGKDGDLGKTYDKIIIADCDVLPIQKYDELFELDPPAGIINEKKAHCISYKDHEYIIPDSVYLDGTWHWHQIYIDIPHGENIPKTITDRIKTDKENMGINASLMLFKPTMNLYRSVMDDLANPLIQKEISTYQWPEMQYITDKLSGQWTNIDLRYSSFNGYPIIDVLYGIHYAGMKPWSIKNDSLTSFGKFEDYQLWFYVYINMLNEFPSLNKGKLNHVYSFIQDLLSKDKKYRFYKTYVPSLKHFSE